MYIESPANDRVRAWTKLKTKKGRSQQGLFMVEGLKLVEEILQSTLEPVSLLWDVGTDELPQSLREQVQTRNVSFYELSPSAFAAVSDTVTPQGVIATAALPQGSPRYPQHVLLLDGIQDPGNVGTLLRSADGFALTEVVCGQGTVDPFSPKVVRSSMGGLFRLSVQTMNATQYIENWLQAWPQGQVTGTSADAEVECQEAEFHRPTLLVIGNEAQGVSKAVARMCHQVVRIPMEEHTESLNAAMAGTILMYETYRQRIHR